MCNLGIREIDFCEFTGVFTNLQGFYSGRRAVLCSAGLPELQDFCGAGDIARC
jgi:hypothetical protein